ncbi:MAG: 4,5-dihydroxyphthalate decarboxylase [Hyphomicrobiales bacterium]|nr:4,5-dihydroxyphthalate decarboxylase [Hyphomicrobiales bacterium]
MTTIPTLSTALKRYPTTKALLTGELTSPNFNFEFHEIEPIHNAFKPMAREQKFDVSELAIFTFLQAYAYKKPLVLLPVVLAARFQHGCIVYNTDFHDHLTPDMLPGKKVGVRAYTQTTGAWVRNILSQEQGVDLESVKWVIFEDAHLAEYKEPSFVTRAPKGTNLLSMLMSGEIDAGILGNDLPEDPKIKPVIPNAAQAGKAWHERTGLIPVNHMLVVTQKLAQERPDLVREVYDLFKRSKEMAPVAPGAIDMRPLGFDAIAPSLELVIQLAFEQQIIPTRFSVEELFADARAILGADA